MSFPCYPAYKDSGVEWLGEVPQHWNVGQSRRRFELRNERALEEDEQLTASQKYGILKQADFIESEGRRVVEVIKGADILKHVEPGDFVISMRSFQGGIEYSPYRGCISSAYVMLSPIKNVYFDFFRWLFKSDRYIQALQSTSNLVRDGQALRFSNFAQVDIPLVPHEEQVLLAGFLDRETTKIDALIAEQQRLIELLQEKRQAAISHAVTKGLNPDVPMKDSGVEWLGEVPEHWETQKLLRYINPLRPVTYGILKPGELDPAGPLMIRAQDYSTGWNSIESIVCVSPEVEEPYARSRVDSGDLLITVVGAGTGNTAFVPKWLHGANISRSTCRIALQDSQVDKAYVKFVLDSDLTVVAIELNSTGAAQPVLNIEQIRNLIIPLPPIPEQIAIRRFLEGISSEISDLIQAASSQRFLLQERRSALISAAVTGQIDVRGLAPEVTAA